MNLTALTYKVPVYQKIKKAIVTVLLVIVGFIAVPTFFPRNRQAGLVLLIEALIIIVALAYLAKVFLYDNKTLVLVDDKILFLNGKKLKEEFSLYDCVVSSYVVRHYYNGIPSGTDLKMRIQQQDGNLLERNCTHFGKKQFNEFMNEIDHRYHHLRNDVQESAVINSVEVIESPEQDTYVFTETKEFILNKKDAMPMSLPVLITIVVMLLFFGIGVPVYAIVEANASVTSMLIFFVPMLAIIAVIVYFQMNRANKALLYAKITPTAVFAGGLNFSKDEIQKIIVTPPAYTSGGQREVTIITANGTYKWNYGNASQNSTQDQYYELVETLRLLMNDRIGVVEFKRV